MGFSDGDSAAGAVTVDEVAEALGHETAEFASAQYGHLPAGDSPAVTEGAESSDNHGR